MHKHDFMESLNLDQCKGFLRSRLMDVLEKKLSFGLKAEGYILGAVSLETIESLPVHGKVEKLKVKGFDYIETITTKDEARKALKKILNQDFDT